MPLPRHRRDSNHNRILRALEPYCMVIDVHGHTFPDFSCDLIAIRGGHTFYIEIKNPSAHRSLTTLEQETAQHLQAAGCKLHVVYDIEGAMRAIGVLL